MRNVRRVPQGRHNAQLQLCAARLLKPRVFSKSYLAIPLEMEPSVYSVCKANLTLRCRSRVPYDLGGNSQARHKYQLATDRQGFHRADRRSICSALGNISRVIGFPAGALPNVNRYPLRIP
jgi:hypothetical protein